MQPAHVWPRGSTSEIMAVPCTCTRHLPTHTHIGSSKVVIEQSNMHTRSSHVHVDKALCRSTHTLARARTHTHTHTHTHAHTHTHTHTHQQTNMQVIAIWITGLLFHIAVRGSPPFQPLGMIGGFLWATGNAMCPFIIDQIGLGLGLLMCASQPNTTPTRLFVHEPTPCHRPDWIGSCSGLARLLQPSAWLLLEPFFCVSAWSMGGLHASRLVTAYSATTSHKTVVTIVMHTTSSTQIMHSQQRLNFPRWLTPTQLPALPISLRQGAR
jgi:hypothetical protein